MVAVAGTSNKTTTARLIGNIFTRDGKRVSMTQHRRRLIEPAIGDGGDRKATRRAPATCCSPSGVDAAVSRPPRRRAAGRPRLRPLQRGRGHQHRHGRSPGPQLHHHRRGLGGGQTRHRREGVGRAAYAVLNAADPTWRPWRRTVRAASPSSPGTLPTGHGPTAPRAVGLLRAASSCAQRARNEHGIPLASVPITRGRHHPSPGRECRRHGPPWALGRPKTIAAGLASFVNDAQTAPGPLQCLQLPRRHPHRRLATTRTPSGPGQYHRHHAGGQALGGHQRRRRPPRRDIRQQTEILGDAFDEVIPIRMPPASAAGGRWRGPGAAARRSVRRPVHHHIEETAASSWPSTALARLESENRASSLIDQVEGSLETTSPSVAPNNWSAGGKRRKSRF